MKGIVKKKKKKKTSDNPQLPCNEKNKTKDKQITLG